MLLLIDNYDSFTYNLYQYLGELGAEVEVVRNDSVSLEDIDELRPERIIISPGPGNPDDAGISKDAIRRFAGTVPILGVCLGHQCIGEVYGGSRRRRGRDPARQGVDDHARRSRRLRRSVVADRSDPLSFAGDPARQRACGARCHGAQRERRHHGCPAQDAPVEGVQFHPESILTADGKAILRNFLAM